MNIDSRCVRCTICFQAIASGPVVHIASTVFAHEDCARLADPGVTLMPERLCRPIEAAVLGGNTR